MSPSRSLPGRAPAFRGGTARRLREGAVVALLFLCAALSVATTVAITWALASETVAFFREVSLLEFATGTRWAPLFSEQAFGVLPLLSATVLIAACSLALAVPAGLAAAVFLSEYAGEWTRAVLKPLLEVLAGIPTVVYGFFALSVIAPALQRLFPETQLFSAAAAGTAMGVMIIPFIASISEDALRAVPRSLREAAYAMGATRFDVTARVVVPAALSGVLAACILGASRAVGETMIVTLAAGGQPNLSWNPLEAMQTMTAYIAAVSLGDTPFGTIEYRTIFAVGSALFLLTFGMNVLGQWLVARFQEAYE